MSYEYIELCSTPYEEDCAQIGEENYNSKSRIECEVYISQLERLFPDAQFGVKSFSHDFGRYREVVVYYDDNDDESTSVAFEVESNLPTEWDGEAKKELKERGYYNGSNTETKI